MKQNLETCLENVTVTKILGNRNIWILELNVDSRQTKKGSLFFAIKGSQVDGHIYIEQAIQRGTDAIVCEDLPDNIHDDVTYIQVKNTQMAMGTMAANFFSNPSKHLKVIGITGTNGKTSVATLLYQTFIRLGYKVGLISTIENKVNEEVYQTLNTTPNSLIIQELMFKMVKSKCTYCFMEVSSLAMVQNRVGGTQFYGTVFTNITHDHLDYHKTFLNYIYAKKKLFDQLEASTFALVNVDDKRSVVMVQNTKAKTYTFSLKKQADFKAKVLENTFEGMCLEFNKQSFWVKLTGLFNAYNLLAVFGVSSLLGISKSTLLPLLSLSEGVKGRFNLYHDLKKSLYAIIDYAHTPDALQNILQTIFEIKIKTQNLVLIVGCGGDRDKGKRSKMGKIACRYSDKTIFTSDNPRYEEPIDIIKDMTADLDEKQKRDVFIIEDREEAILKGLNLLEKNDIILIAGKGHEIYQDIKGIKYAFDDVQKILDAVGFNFSV